MRGPALQALREGVELEDGTTAPARVRRLAPDTLEITIHEGRKRQVRRMCDAVGHPVAALERVAFGPLGLRGLAPGEHRRLTTPDRAPRHAGASPQGEKPGPRGAARRRTATGRRRAGAARRRTVLTAATARAARGPFVPAR